MKSHKKTHTRITTNEETKFECQGKERREKPSTESSFVDAPPSPRVQALNDIETLVLREKSRQKGLSVPYM